MEPEEQEEELLKIWESVSSDYLASDPPLSLERWRVLCERERVYENNEWIEEVALQDQQQSYQLPRKEQSTPDRIRAEGLGDSINAQTMLHRIGRYAGICIHAITLRRNTAFGIKLLGQIKVRDWEHEIVSEEIIPLMPKFVAAQVISELALNYPKYAWEIAEAPLFQGDAEGFLAIRILRARGNIRNDDDLSRARSAVMHQVEYWWKHEKQERFGGRLRLHAIQAFLNLWRETSQRQDLQDAYKFCGMLTDPIIVADARVRIMSTTWEPVDLIEAREAILRIPDARVRAQQGLIMINNLVGYLPHAPDKFAFTTIAHSLAAQMPENWRALILEKFKKAKQ